jgi:hypothetical protein
MRLMIYKWYDKLLERSPKLDLATCKIYIELINIKKSNGKEHLQVNQRGQSSYPAEWKPSIQKSETLPY